jgi:hypothetical protein
MAKVTAWAGKVLSLIKVGNTQAAIAQIKVAPTVKDLNSLKAAMLESQLVGRSHALDGAVEDNLALLAAPRLHRAP